MHSSYPPNFHLLILSGVGSRHILPCFLDYDIPPCSSMPSRYFSLSSPSNMIGTRILGMSSTLCRHFNFYNVYLFLVGTFPVLPIVCHPSFLRIKHFLFCHLYCFQLLKQFRVPFPYLSCNVQLWYKHPYQNTSFSPRIEL